MPLTVAAAGLLGSGHCAGMCGPLILSLARERRALFCYHLARVGAYALAGLFAGLLGSGLSVHAPRWLASTLLILLALIVIVGGVFQMRNQASPFGFFGFVHGPLRRARARTTTFRARLPLLCASLSGGLSVFLPCGHLYAFLAAAAATGTALKGAVLMASFALGTLPMLGFGLGAMQRALHPTLRLRATGALLIVAGLLSLAGFASDWRNSSRPDAQASKGPMHDVPAAAKLQCH